MPSLGICWGSLKPTTQKYCVWPNCGKGFAIGALFFCWLLGGCGYTLNHRLIETFKSPKGFFIPLFDNKTQEVGSEMVFTNALIRELLSHGEKIASDSQEGALELRGTITQVQRAVEVQSAAGLGRLETYQRVPDQIGVRAFVLVQLVDPKTQEVKWSREFDSYRRITAPLDRTMDVDAPSSLGLKTESLIENSYNLIARDMMRDVYDAMVEVF
ncbi:hypothetical protein EBR78_06945 [bacterium]|nr:hypothetical protein [bacterium]NBX82261.1 hypothetical protein [bacterium]